MIYIDLLLNLAMLVAISIVSGFIDKRLPRNTAVGVLIQGVLFGVAAVLGMLRPFNLGPGLIFDGRSIMVSICALFFGPWAALMASFLTITCRVMIGGVGAVTGSLVVISSALIGLIAHFRLRPELNPPSAWSLFLFGTLVHTVMLAIMLTLPEGSGIAVIQRIVLPVLLTYPVATILTGKILSDQITAIRTMSELQKAKSDLENNQNQAHSLIQARLALVEYSVNHTLDELLTKALDETGKLVNSPVGFYHFVEADQKTLSLQQWSSQTLNEFCHAQGKGIHYDIEKAGVWVDCIHQKRTVVHNDYESLPHKKGLPEGHATVIRELVTPIMRKNKIVAILGVGNKPTEYTQKDVEIVSYLADVTWQLIEKKRNEELLQKSELKYRDLFENAPIGIFTTTSRGEALSVNSAMANMLGFSSPEETIKHYKDLQTDLYVNPERRTEFIEELNKKGKVENFEYQANTADGRKVWLRMHARVVRNNKRAKQQTQYGQEKTITPQDSMDYFVIEGFTTDITDQRRVEEQFRQAQKMESVGRLAGGVAHDYNNMLSVILGYTEPALGKVSPSDKLYGELQEILKAGRRSAEITKQLLAFARKQTIAPKVLNLNATVEGLLKMIRRLIGEDIDLAWLPGSKSLWPVKMDTSQLDQILANLCVNARDAIDGVGKITIETGMVTFDGDYCKKHTGFVPGDFVLLAVSDNGSGMDKKTQEKLFEPFFTTKAVGKGTGLGLATIYGIVKQNRGFINVYSEPGKGATFRIYLPRHITEDDDIDFSMYRESKIEAGHGETLLIVEDEPSILNMSEDMLKKLGYKVLTAGRVQEGIKLAKEHIGNIRLLITDVVMPDMNGKELARQLRQIDPDIKVLFMSGYTANVIAHHGVLDDGVVFIQKPFSMSDLSAKVHEALNQ